MALLTALAIGSIVAGTALTAFGQYRNILAESKAQKYQSEIAANNATLTNIEADMVRAEGLKASNRYRLAVARMLSSQRTAFAASGVDVSGGTPVEVLQSTAQIGEAEAINIRRNSLLDVWKLRNQAQGYQAESGLLADAAKERRRNIWPTIGGTLLGGLGQGLAAGAPRR